MLNISWLIFKDDFLKKIVLPYQYFKPLSNLAYNHMTILGI